MAKLVADDAADDEIKADQSFFSDQAEARKGNLKAMPGYDRTYVPVSVLLSTVGGIYSGAFAGPHNL